MKKYGMTSIKEIYKIGRGPSSSHTIGPERACKIFKEKNTSADSFKAILYGSLAKTGKGHGTDTVIKKTFLPFDCEIIFDVDTTDLPHPNTMQLIALNDAKETAKTFFTALAAVIYALKMNRPTAKQLFIRTTSFQI